MDRSLSAHGAQRARCSAVLVRPRAGRPGPQSAGAGCVCHCSSAALRARRPADAQEHRAHPVHCLLPVRLRERRGAAPGLRGRLPRRPGVPGRLLAGAPRQAQASRAPRCGRALGPGPAAGRLLPGPAVLPGRRWQLALPACLAGDMRIPGLGLHAPLHGGGGLVLPERSAGDGRGVGADRQRLRLQQPPLGGVLGRGARGLRGVGLVDLQRRGRGPAGGLGRPLRAEPAPRAAPGPRAPRASAGLAAGGGGGPGQGALRPAD
mmetsp:Transcript_65706/g.186498  ORF Transcript_65706/g.186498 Transcript_65706/m.186498 type:complete len:263 (+) Transcript_65706:1473-2261(+)